MGYLPMPFVTVNGCPSETPQKVLSTLRRKLVKSVSRKMGVSPSWVRPFFPKDMLDDPTSELDGSSTIYVRLETGMFSGELTAEQESKAVGVVSAIAQIVFDAFEGKFEVEVMIVHL